MDDRARICEKLGLNNPLHAHHVIMEGLKKGPTFLKGKGLNARTLGKLGYCRESMLRLGFRDGDLKKLGYVALSQVSISKEKLPERGLVDSPDYLKEPSGGKWGDLRKLVEKGFDSNQLKQRGYTLRHLKDAGYDARELARMGFRLDELIHEFTLQRLRVAGFNVRDLSRYFQGDELRNAGFSARDMKAAGYGVRDLLNFGYNENHVIAAGYSTADLIAEGLSRITHDPNKQKKF